MPGNITGSGEEDRNDLDMRHEFRRRMGMGSGVLGVYDRHDITDYATCL
jgi:hypothetical protein